MTETNDPREMRKQIHRAGSGYERVDGKPATDWSMTPAGHMIKSVLVSSRCFGWSGEDAMTTLAYHALRGYEGLHDRVLHAASLEPPAPIVVTQQKQLSDDDIRHCAQANGVWAVYRGAVGSSAEHNAKLVVFARALLKAAS